MKKKKFQLHDQIIDLTMGPLTGTMASTVWASVFLRRMSMKEMTCSVFPKPML